MERERVANLHLEAEGKPILGYIKLTKVYLLVSTGVKVKNDKTKGLK